MGSATEGTGTPAIPRVVCARAKAAIAEPADEPPLQIELGGAPRAVVVPVRQPVCFSNRDTICHDPFSSSDGNDFELGLLAPGASRTVSFDRPGLVQVYCSLHTGKQLTLVVVPGRRFSEVGADGRFEIDGLVPGDYVLEAFGEGLSASSVEVTVSAHASVDVEIRAGAPDEAGGG